MHRLIHPDYTLHVNEYGCNTSQKIYSHIRGMGFLTALGTIPATVTSDNGNHFIIVCYADGNGKPVICLIIMTGM